LAVGNSVGTGLEFQTNPKLNRIGLGVAADTTRRILIDETTAVPTSYVGVYSRISFSTARTPDEGFRAAGRFASVFTGGASEDDEELEGISAQAYHNGEGDADTVVGITARAWTSTDSSTGTALGAQTAGVVTGRMVGIVADAAHRGSGNVSQAYGIRAQYRHLEDGTCGTGASLQAHLVQNDGTITAGYGLRVGSFTQNGGTMTTCYGIYIHANTTIGTTNYALYSDSVADNVLKGRLFVSTPDSAPTDATLFSNSVSAYLDEAANKLHFRAKYSDNSLKTGEVALT